MVEVTERNGGRSTQRQKRQKETSGIPFLSCYCSCVRLRMYLKIPVVLGGWGKDGGRMGEGTTLSQNASQLVSASEQPKKYVLDLRGGRNSVPSEALSRCFWSHFGYTGFSPDRSTYLYWK